MQKRVEELIAAFLEKNRNMVKIPLLVLLGPTASGKTALSLELAKKFNGEIISADSRQVYREMDIGTDKIMPEMRRGIAHYAIDVVNPDERFTVADFKRLADEKIADIHRRGKLPMLVGGTGLYLRAVAENFLIPPENPQLRKQLMEELKEKGTTEMHKKLARLDPAAAAAISANNIPYFIRALEIVITTGKPKGAQKGPSKYECLRIGLQRDRTTLFSYIEQRIEEQIKRGLLEETQKLLTRYSPDLTSMKSLGYKEIVEYIQGRLSLADAISLLKKNTRNFAKRQIVWWKKEKDIMWISID